MSELQTTSNRWLFVGAVMAMVLGMGLAWSQLAVQWGDTLPSQLAAKVGSQWLTRDELQRAINGANNARREPLTPQQEQEVLARLVNELLLLQYGQDLGLVTNDPNVRKPLVQSVLGMVRANAKAQNISVSEARKWFDDNRLHFQHEGKYQVIYYRVMAAEQSEANSRALSNILSQQSADQASVTPQQLTAWRAERVNYLPSAMLPPNKLRDYLGQVLAEAVMNLGGLGVTEPVAINGGFAVLQVVGYQPAGVPPFEQIQAQVIGEMQRRAGEQELASLLSELRDDYEVQLAPDWSSQAGQ